MASGNSLCGWDVLAAQPPASNYAILAQRNGMFVLEYDPSTEQARIFYGILPNNYDGGGVKVRLEWSLSGATSGDVVWSAAFERHDTATDLDSDSFATAQTVTDTAPATDGAPEYAEITLTDGAQMDGLLAGEAFRLKISRVAADGADTATVVAQLRSVQVQEV